MSKHTSYKPWIILLALTHFRYKWMTWVISWACGKKGVVRERVRQREIGPLLVHWEIASSSQHVVLMKSMPRIYQLSIAPVQRSSSNYFLLNNGWFRCYMQILYFWAPVLLKDCWKCVIRDFHHVPETKYSYIYV